MATGPTLQELLTCPVCTDLYTSPKLLVCQHTLCSSCVEQMFNFQYSGRIQCPICRVPSSKHQIKVDFKTNSFLESHHSTVFNNSSAANLTDVKTCELCNKLKVEKHCTDCDRLLCETCSGAHNGIPSCKDHKIKSLDDIFTKKHSQLKVVKMEIDQNQTELNQRIECVNTYKDDVNTLCTNLIEKANKWHSETIRKVNEHHKLITDQLKNIQEEEHNDIAKVDQKLNCYQQEINKFLLKYNELDTEQDASTFLGGVDDVLKCDLSVHLKKNLDSVSKRILQSSFPTVTLNFGQQWDEQKGLILEINKRTSYNPLVAILNIWSHKKTFPRKTLTGKFTMKQRFEADNLTKDLFFNGMDILCLFKTYLEKYNKQGIFLGKIVDNLSQACAMTCTQNYIIIATMGSGLLSYKKSGQFHSKLDQGNFCDVTNDDLNSIYALDYNDNTPKVNKYSKGFNKNKWEKIQEVKLPFDTLSLWNSIIWSGNSIMVTSSSTESAYLYRIHPSGVILQTHHWPQSVLRLCCADSNGDVLIADPVNNALSVFHSVKKQKYQLNWELDTGHGKPYSVTMDNENGFWVSNNSKNIVCYKLIQ